MKINILTPFILAYFATTGLADDEKKYDDDKNWSNEVTVQLANDQSGANANVKVPADGEKRSIGSLWGWTAVAKDGVVFATSAQLVKFEQDTACEIFDDYYLDAKLNARQTWVSLKGGAVVKLKDAFIACYDHDDHWY
ncbi:uncharacterized protein N7529_006375 [Penicillium soppii]|jgi:hypothetical protein|uniref:uncharacterized protein n=1 Tax=Penicillium soppii TaxID=69789 RepID=UPI002547A67E|nr:uncharacterized protein N7529_006375 [Penicillium soppii]KAJ5864459.1 hypothetical protein N7529_006375 [Penicillium soppii]